MRARKRNHVLAGNVMLARLLRVCRIARSYALQDPRFCWLCMPKEIH